MHKEPEAKAAGASWTRRKFIKAIAAGGITAAAGVGLFRCLKTREQDAATHIARVPGYESDLRSVLTQGLVELKITTSEITGKRILLKPNLVEPHLGSAHINTHPLVIQAAAEVFLQLGAAQVIVAEGAGHRRDALLVLEESGLAEVLYEDRIPFIDLNSGPTVEVSIRDGVSKLGKLVLPREIVRADFIVSLAKMKTHHWAGVTLAMKNMFGVMPGIVYGWPKNVLHWAGIPQSILDINATVKPHLAIVDGIVGMEGDGPIMGTPVSSNVLVMGRNFPAVDATCARIMGIDPEKIDYLKFASGWLGTIGEKSIEQRGENIAAVQKDFQLIDFIPAQKGLRG